MQRILLLVLVALASASVRVSAQLSLLANYSVSPSFPGYDCTPQDALYLPGSNGGEPSGTIPVLVIAYNCLAADGSNQGFGAMVFVDPLEGEFLEPPIAQSNVLYDTNPGNGFTMINGTTGIFIGGLDEDTFVVGFQCQGTTPRDFSGWLSYPTPPPPYWKFSANAGGPVLKDGRVLVLLKDNGTFPKSYAIGRITFNSGLPQIEIDVVALLDISLWQNQAVNVMAAWDPSGSQLILASGVINTPISPFLGFQLGQVTHGKKRLKLHDQHRPLTKRSSTHRKLPRAPPTIPASVVIHPPSGTSFAYMPAFTQPGSGFAQQVTGAQSIAQESVNFAQGAVNSNSTYDFQQLPENFVLSTIGYNQMETPASCNGTYISFLLQAANNPQQLLMQVLQVSPDGWTEVAVQQVNVSAMAVDSENRYLFLVSQTSSQVLVYATN